MRMNHFVVVNSHWAFSTGVRMVLKALPFLVDSSVQVFSNNGADFLTSIIDEGRLEKRFGGDLPNKEGEFWPPRFNY